MRYDDAVASLFQVPLDQFVTERKRVAGELKAAGDKAAATRLAKLGRPPISAWAVNQLWWHARPAFDALFDTAQRLRDGKLDAMAAHRDAIAGLRAHAARLLTEADHGATEATLRKVTQTLSALAAAGGWDPDPPGALSADRDPPGFEAAGVSNVIPFPVQPRPPEHDGEHPAKHDGEHPAKHDGKHATKHDGKHADTDDVAHKRRDAAEAKRRAELAAATARAEAAAELRRAEASRARAAAERHRLEAALRTAQGDVKQREREVARLERELVSARDLVGQAKAIVEDLEARMALLDN